MGRRKRGLVAEQLEEILDEIAKNVEKKSQDEFRNGAEEAVQLLREKSPRRVPHGGAYAASWDMKVIHRGPIKGYIVYNKEHYQLTHLLENGHAKVNGGRVKAIPHIGPVELVTSTRVLDKLEQMQL